MRITREEKLEKMIDHELNTLSKEWDERIESFFYSLKDIQEKAVAYSGLLMTVYIFFFLIGGEGLNVEGVKQFLEKGVFDFFAKIIAVYLLVVMVESVLQAVYKVIALTIKKKAPKSSVVKNIKLAYVIKRWISLLMYLSVFIIAGVLGFTSKEKKDQSGPATIEVSSHYDHERLTK